MTLSRFQNRLGGRDTANDEDRKQIDADEGQR